MHVILQDIYKCLRVTYCRTGINIATRQLSVVDFTFSTMYMLNDFVIFLSNPSKKLSKSMLNTIYFCHKMKHLMKSKRALKLMKEIYNKTKKPPATQYLFLNFASNEKICKNINMGFSKKRWC